MCQLRVHLALLNETRPSPFFTASKQKIESSEQCSLIPRLYSHPNEKLKLRGKAQYQFVRDIVGRHLCTNYLNNLKCHSREDLKVATKYSQLRSLLLQLVYRCVAMLEL